MLPVIFAGVAACAAAAWVLSRDGNGGSQGPKHEPGRNMNENEKKRIEEQARRQAVADAERERAEFHAKMKAEQEKFKMAREEAEAERKKADAEFARKAEQMKKAAAEKALRDEEERRRKEREEYPMPEFLAKEGGTKGWNWAVVGDSGQGKSSLINLIMDKPDLAPVGVTETTMEPTPYSVEGHDLSFWDLPGAGTEKFPQGTYLQKMGLRYFDLVFIVSSGRWKEHDKLLMKELDRHGVPFFVLRTKVDLDIDNNYDDKGIKPEDTLKQLRKECHEAGLDDVFFITKKKKELDRSPQWYDNGKLLQAVVTKMAEVRHCSSSAGADATLRSETKSAKSGGPNKVEEPKMQWCATPSTRKPHELVHPNGTPVRMMSTLVRLTRRIK